MTISKDEYELVLMALCLWREARGEPAEAKAGVAHSILNRIKAKSWFGDTISEVIARKWQYSGMTAKGDNNLIKWPVMSATAMRNPDEVAFHECLLLASVCASGEMPDPTSGATHYFDERLAAFKPQWAIDGEFRAKLGHLHFYLAR
jgi:spore germination cell wall hydrolase CwlJ-like protein